MGAVAPLPPTAPATSPRRPPAFARAAAAQAFAAAAVFAAGGLGLLLAAAHEWPPAFHPAAGVAVAAVLAARRVWPGVFAGSLLVNLLAPVPAWVGVGVAAGTAGEALLAAALLRRVGGGPLRLDQLGGVVALLVRGAAVAAAPAAALAGGLLWAAGLTPGARVPHAAVAWWLADGAAVILMVPAVLAARGRRPAARVSRYGIEAALLLAVAGGLAGFADAAALGDRPPAVGAFVFCFPFGVWAALRFGPPGAAAANLLTAALAVGLTAGGVVGAGGGDHPVHLLLFVTVAGVTALALGAAVAERDEGVRAIEDARRRHEEAERLARIGGWELDLATGAVSWSPELYRQHGYDPAELPRPSTVTAMERVHPDDRPRVVAAMDRAVRTGEAAAVEYRIRLPGGGERVVRSYGHPLAGPDGRPARLTGFCQDVSSEAGAVAAVARGERLSLAVAEAAGVLVRAAAVDAAVPAVLESLGRATESSRAYLLTCRPDGPEVVFALAAEWAAPGVAPPADRPEFRAEAAGLAGWVDVLAAGGVVHGRAADFPDRERAALEARGARSAAAAGVLVDGRLWGVLGFDECATDRAWTAAEREGLRTAAAVVAGAVARQQAYDKLRHSREMLEETGRLARVGGWEYEVGAAGPVWTAEVYRIHELPDEAAPTLEYVTAAVAPEARPAMAAAVEKGMADGSGWDLLLPLVTARGNRRWVHAVGHTEFRDGAPPRLYGSLQDVTARVEAERAVERSEARYRQLFETAPVGIWEEDLTAVGGWFDRLRAAGVTDLGAYLAARPEAVGEAVRLIRVRDVNPAAVAMTGARDRAELMAGLDKLLTPDSRRSVAAELVALWDGRRSFARESEAARLDGRRVWVAFHLSVPDAGGRPDLSRVVVTALDLTERKRLEEQFLQAQKMEAVGRLAGGVAHDFNNLLTIINGYADLLARELPAGSRPAELAGHVRAAGERAAGLTRQLLSFSRRQKVDPTALDLSGVVGGLEPLLRRLIREDIRLETRLAAGLPAVTADRGQVEQVVMNLAVNARDAMPGGGTLTISTAAVVVGGPPHGPAAAGGGVPPGRYVVLAVSDTGEGIPPHVRPHLFEPFFTTKEAGRGTGLGLSTVYAVVEYAGGHLRYDTEVGRGTTFRAYLPAAGGAADPPPAAAPPAPLPTAAGRVLLVEDEPAVRMLTHEVLRQAGFAVTVAEDGPSALAAAAAGRFDVLVTDVVMPRMGGHELAERLTAADPSLRVLFVSGYTPDPGGLSLPGAAALPKPFTPDALVRAVRGLMDG